MYHNCNISKCSIHIAGNVLNCNKLYLVYRPFTLCVTIFLANRMKPCCPRWPPHVEMLAAGDVKHAVLSGQSKKSA